MEEAERAVVPPRDGNQFAEKFGGKDDGEVGAPGSAS